MRSRVTDGLLRGAVENVATVHLTSRREQLCVRELEAELLENMTRGVVFRMMAGEKRGCAERVERMMNDGTRGFRGNSAAPELRA